MRDKQESLKLWILKRRRRDSRRYVLSRRRAGRKYNNTAIGTIKTMLNKIKYRDSREKGETHRMYGNTGAFVENRKNFFFFEKR